MTDDFSIKHFLCFRSHSGSQKDVGDLGRGWHGPAVLRAPQAGLLVLSDAALQGLPVCSRRQRPSTFTWLPTQCGMQSRGRT